MHLADKKAAKGNSKYINGTLISSLRAKTVIAASKIFLRSEKKYSAQQGKKFCAARNKIPCCAEKKSLLQEILALATLTKKRTSSRRFLLIRLLLSYSYSLSVPIEGTAAWTDAWTDPWTDPWTDARTGPWTNARTGPWTNARARTRGKLILKIEK